jgi:hypothetical protein
MLMHMTSRFNQLRRKMNGEVHDRSGGFLNFHEVLGEFLGELSGVCHRARRRTAQSFAIRMLRRAHRGAGKGSRHSLAVMSQRFGVMLSGLDGLDP